MTTSDVDYDGVKMKQYTVNGKPAGMSTEYKDVKLNVYKGYIWYGEGEQKLDGKFTHVKTTVSIKMA